MVMVPSGRGYSVHLAILTVCSLSSLLLMTVLYRNSEGLVGHPLLRHLSVVQAQGNMLYEEVAKCLPPLLTTLPFSIKLTGDKVCL